ncbi:MAG: DNA gyrase subunit A [Alphaproteobacteria bacterium]
MSDTPDPKSPAPPGGPTSLVSIEEEMKRSYLDYAMSVIVARALPDVRDGLKPVHRRILYTMHENGFAPNKPHKKSARVTGDVMGKYHPHGNLAIYDALVRMAQDFSMRLPLIDGQGNFGSVDGDPPAAERYTEVRLAPPAIPLLDDLDKDTVDFRPNYSNEFQEPVVLPAKFPNLLVNGAGGIAVGMATNIPPHNLGEVVDACIAYIENPAIEIEEILQHLPGPDFPTGGLILGRMGIRSAMHKGRASIVMRGRAHIEEIRKDREAIIITEIPYQVNKASMIEKIAELVREKRIEGIADMHDESNRHGMRVVVELKRDAMPDIVLNQLYRFSPLQSTFGVNMLALDGGRPQLMSIRDIIAAFIRFREEVITRRTKFELTKARERAHVLVGLAIAVANIDEVIALIRKAPDPATAKDQLMTRRWPAKDMGPLVALVADPRHVIADDGTITLSEEQAKAILELRLQRLTALGRDEIGNELKELGGKIADYLDILRSRARVYQIIKDELAGIKAEFATPRRTEIVELDGEMEDEDLIPEEDMVITVTHGGYIKRVPLATYRPQRRGGKGRSGMATREEDFVTRLFVANTHQPMLFFSSSGMAYKLKVWRLPEGTPQSRGRAMVNLLPLAQGETITTIMALPKDEAGWDRLQLMFATRSGDVRRNALSDFESVRANGKIAMKLEPGDQIVDVMICTEADDVLLTSAKGKSIRFSVDEVRVFKGRESTGVRGIKLADDDRVIGMSILRHVDIDVAEARAYLKQSAAVRRAAQGEAAEVEVPAPDDEETSTEIAALSTERYAELGGREQVVLAVTANGFGKRSSAYEYRVTGRGGQGIISIVTNERNGDVVAAFPVEESNQLMLVTDQGQTIRVPVDDIRIAGRNTQGVTLFRTAAGERVVSVERIEGESGESDSEGENGGGADSGDAAGE